MLQEESFLNDNFLGRKCIIGGDGFLTYRANLQVIRHSYQDIVVAETASPPTYLISNCFLSNS